LRHATLQRFDYATTMASPTKQQDNGPSSTNAADQGAIQVAIPKNQIIDQHVQCVDVPGKGRGLITTRAFAANEQILYIHQPLSVDILDGQIPQRCYYCLDLTLDTKETLQRCSQCRKVKYCSKECQKLSWERQHKYECKIMRRQVDSVKGHHRSAICLVRSFERTRFSPQENADLLDLESHQADICKEEGEWRLFGSLVSSIKSYTRTELAFNLVHKLICILMTNSLPLYDGERSRIGSVLHPLAAKINHSCQPSVYLRTDVSPGMSKDTNPRPVLGSISIHALQPVAAGEELTISSQGFVGEPLSSKHIRQAELQTRYFFTCTCPLCASPGLPINDDAELKEALDLARSLLPRMIQPETILIRQQMALGYRAALTALALTNAESKAKGTYECPAQEIRFRLMRIISVSHETHPVANLHLEAFLLNLLVVFRSDTAIDAMTQRPFNMSERLVLYYRALDLAKMMRSPAGALLNETLSVDLEQLDNFILMLLHELDEDANAALVARPGQPAPMMGLIEKTVFKTVEAVSSGAARVAWSRYRVDQQANKAKAMKWLNGVIDDQLDWEEKGRWWFPCPRRVKNVKSVALEHARIKRSMETGKQGVLMRALLEYEKAWEKDEISGADVEVALNGISNGKD
jgi:hypothetical protein